MVQSQQTKSSNVNERVLLYRLVFRARAVGLAVLILLASFVTQPINQAFADETAAALTTEEVTVDNTIPEPVADLPDDSVEQPTTDESAVTTTPPSEADVAAATPPDPALETPVNEPDTIASAGDEFAEPPTSTTTVGAASDVDSDQETDTDGVGSSTAAITNGVGSSTASSTDGVDSSASFVSTTTPTDSSASTTVAGAATTTEYNAATTTALPTAEPDVLVAEPTAATLPDTPDEPQATTPLSELPAVSTSTPSTTVSQNADTPTTVSSPDPFAYIKQHCLSVGDGAFYCQEPTEQTLHPALDALYAAPDDDGDLEIFLSLGGELEQLTHNTYDDSAPQYDSESDRIVWHRLIDDYHQIYVHDRTSNETTPLTTGQRNHMQPALWDEYIVWQEWDGTDWEIVLFDGDEYQVLTTNEYADIAPTISDGFVLWTATDGSGESTAMVYELRTKDTQRIEGYEGGKLQNARFVLVYDTKFDNGDILTKGFDPNDGTVLDLAALPADLPAEIPDSEPTEEVRALLQNKSSKEDGDADIEVVVKTPDVGTSTTAGTSTTTVSTFTNPTATVDLSAPVSAPSFELSEYDVVLIATPTVPTTPHVSELAH